MRIDRDVGWAIVACVLVILITVLSYLDGYSEGEEDCAAEMQLQEVECPESLVPVKVKGQWGCWDGGR
jgi:hypothetical protein